VNERERKWHVVRETLKQEQLPTLDDLEFVVGEFDRIAREKDLLEETAELRHRVLVEGRV